MSREPDLSERDAAILKAKIQELLDANGGNISATAKLLGVAQPALTQVLGKLAKPPGLKMLRGLSRHHGVPEWKVLEKEPPAAEDKMLDLTNDAVMFIVQLEEMGASAGHIKAFKHKLRTNDLSAGWTLEQLAAEWAATEAGLGRVSQVLSDMAPAAKGGAPLDLEPLKPKRKR